MSDTSTSKLARDKLPTTLVQMDAPGMYQLPEWMQGEPDADNAKFTKYLRYVKMKQQPLQYLLFLLRERFSLK